MLDVATPLDGQHFTTEGFTLSVADTNLITYRGDLADPKLAAVLRDALGATMPAQGGLVQGSLGALGWMSPDELLILTQEPAGPIVGQIAQAMAGNHHLVLDLSDARAVMVLQGRGVRRILAKVTPADLRPASAPAGSLRRTRIGQVPAAILFLEDEVRVLCFRSVARYVFDLLAQSAKDGLPD